MGPSTGVPVIIWEQGLMDNMNMSTGGGTENNETQLAMNNTTHPLAAGLSDPATVTNGGERFTYATGLGADAITIATVDNDSSRYTIFAYDIGDTMVGGGTAPHRRVGFFLEETTASNWNGSGQALFAAAVDWAINGD